MRKIYYYFPCRMLIYFSSIVARNQNSFVIILKSWVYYILFIYILFTLYVV